MNKKKKKSEKLKIPLRTPRIYDNNRKTCANKKKTPKAKV